MRGRPIKRTLRGIDPDNHRLRFVQVRHAVRHCRLLGLRRWLVRAGGQDCDGPFVRQAPIGSRPIRSASYRMIRRWAMTDRSKRGHEVSQLEGQAITHRHPPVSPSDTDRRENDAHSQLDRRKTFFSLIKRPPSLGQQAHVTTSHSTHARVRSTR